MVDAIAFGAMEGFHWLCHSTRRASICNVAVDTPVDLVLSRGNMFTVVVTCLAEHVDSSVEEVTAVLFTVCRRRFVCTATGALD